MAAASLSVAQERALLLEEVIVTAERRQESLQDVPLSITAFGSDVRDRLGIVSIQDMANFAPGVTYDTSQDRPSIRGIGRQSNFFTMDSPVANYFDGVYTSSVQDAQRRPIFVERTEILRGPQGALSGRGSIGGAINTTSKMPRDTFGGEVRANFGDYSRYALEGTVTGPLTDWARLRLNAGTYHQDEGYFENVALNRTEGDQPNNRETIDVLFEADLGESVDLFLKAAWADYDETRRTLVSLAPYVAGNQSAPNPYGISGSSFIPVASWGYFAGSNGVALSGLNQNPALSGDKRKFAADFPSRQKLDNHHNYTAHLTWRAPGVDIKWIGGHQNYRYTQWIDADGTDVVSMQLPLGRVVNPGGSNMYMEDREWFSNELTFTSTSDGPLRWILGLYQSNEDYFQEPATLIYPGYPELNAPAGALANPVDFRAQYGFMDGETVSRAAFGQIDFQFNDQWKLTFGLRYNEDEKEASEATRYIGNNFLVPVAPGIGLADVGVAIDVTPVPVPGAPLPRGVVRDYGIDPTTGYRERDLKASWSATTGSVGVDFTPTSDDLIYLRFARGYRPGGFSSGGFIDNTAPTQVDEEKVDSYELGYKTTLAGRLQLSVAAFYYDYQDIQLSLPTLGRCTDPSDLSSCTTIASFLNLESGETKGLEVEMNWAVTDRLSAYFTYGYLDASVKDGLGPNGTGFINPDDRAAVLQNANRHQQVPGQMDTGYTFLPVYTQDLSGNSLAYAPEHRVGLNLNYTVPFSAGSLTLSGSYAWRDKQYSNVFEMEEFSVPSWNTVGARIIWTDAEDRYTVMFYGTNLTDEIAVDAVLPLGAADPLPSRQATGLASASAPSAAGAAYYNRLNLQPPREWGVEVQYRFGGR